MAMKEKNYNLAAVDEMIEEYNRLYDYLYHITLLYYKYVRAGSDLKDLKSVDQYRVLDREVVRVQSHLDTVYKILSAIVPNFPRPIVCVTDTFVVFRFSSAGQLIRVGFVNKTDEEITDIIEKSDPQFGFHCGEDKRLVVGRLYYADFDTTHKWNEDDMAHSGRFGFLSK